MKNNTICIYIRLLVAIIFVLGSAGNAFGAFGDRYWGVFGFEVNSNQTIIRVYPGSPAAGKLNVGETVSEINNLGARTFDREYVFGEFLDEIESRNGGGSVAIRLSSGRVVSLVVAAKGSWSATAPVNCAKCNRIVSEAIDYVLNTQHKGKLRTELLALLATGDARALAHFVTEKGVLYNASAHANANWYLGFQLITLCEYYLLTSDSSVVSVIERLSKQLYSYRDTAGLWAAGVDRVELEKYPNGPLRGPGYGSYHSVTFQCQLALLLVERCGLADADIVQHNRLLTAYLKSTVGRLLPYSSYIIANEGGYSANGQAALAALCLAMAGEIEDARYYIGLCLAGGDEIEKGHTGPYFGQFWTGLGVGLAGDFAVSEYFKRTRWVRSQQRRWDGGFRYDSWKGLSYSGMSETSGNLLAFSQARKKLVITGKGMPAGLSFTNAEVARTLVSLNVSQPKDFSWVWEHRNNYDPDIRSHAVSEGGKYLGNATYYNWIKTALVSGSLMDRLGAYESVRTLRSKFSASQRDEMYSLLFSVARDDGESVRYRRWAIEVLLGKYYDILRGDDFRALLEVYYDDSVFVNRYEDRYIGPLISTYLKRKGSFGNIVSGPFGGDLAGYRRLVGVMLQHRHASTRGEGKILLERSESSQEILFQSEAIREVILDERRDYIGYAGRHASADPLPVRMRGFLEERSIPVDSVLGVSPKARLNLSRVPGAVASQSTTGFGGNAARAIDGNRDGNYAGGSVTHTFSVEGSWWQVDLGGVAEIDSIVLYNRLEGLERRLSNYRIEILDQHGVLVKGQDFHTVSGHTGVSEEWSFDAVYGQVVRVSMLGANREGNHVLSLAEVEVMGKEPSFELLEQVNWALVPGVSARQSTTLDGKVAGRAIDGNRDGSFNGASFMETKNEVGSWWEVDLGAERSISRLKFHMLENDFMVRIKYSNIRLLVYDKTGALVFTRDYSDGPLEVSLPAGFRGKRIRLERTAPSLFNNSTISFAELEVFATKVVKNVSLDRLLRDAVAIDLELLDNGQVKVRPAGDGGVVLSYQWSVDMKTWHSVGDTAQGYVTSYVGAANSVSGERVINVTPKPRRFFVRGADN